MENELIMWKWLQRWRDTRRVRATLRAKARLAEFDARMLAEYPVAAEAFYGLLETVELPTDSDKGE